MHENKRMRRFICMRRCLCRVLALGLAGICLLSPVLAESTGLVGEARLEIAAWPDLARESLEAMQEWLGGLSLKLYAGEGRSAVTLLDGGREVLAADSRQTGGENSLLLEVPGSLAPTLYLGTLDAPPLQTLFGAPALPDPAGVPEALGRLYETLLEGLKPFEESQATRTTIKRVGRAESRLNYVLSAEEANAVWQAALPRLVEIVQQGASGLPAAWREAAAQALSTLRFTGKLTLRRLLDEARGDLGLQVTAGIEVLGEARKVEFTAGYQAQTGLYIKFNFPAARGRDSLEALVSLAFSQKEGVSLVKGDYSLAQAKAGDKRSLKGKADLALAPEGGGMRLKGTLTAQARYSGSVTLKRDHLLAPDMLLESGGAAGALKWTEAEGKTLLRDLTVRLVAGPGAAPPEKAPQARVDLREANPAAREYAARQAAEALVPYLMEKTLQMQEDTRLLVLHDWGRVRRALAESSMEPLHNRGPGAFTVTEDADTLP